MKSLAIILLFIGTQTAHGDFLSVQPVRDPERPRNAVWLPLGSFFLPGLGQYVERQWASGATYTTLGVTGLGLAASALSSMDENNAQDTDFQDLNGLQRQYLYGTQLYMFAGEMSAYHTFRTAVETRKPYGSYTFLRESETSLDLALSVFAFDELLRPTTFTPLLLLALLGSAGIDPDAYLDFGDSAFTAGVSFNAGVGEEAFFRGYFMPVLRQSFNSNFWSNAAQSVVFGAAHISSFNRVPIAQTLMGFYLGWLTQRNGWSLRQSVFIHTWWDVLALGFSIADQNGRRAVARPVPLFSLSF